MSAMDAVLQQRVKNAWQPLTFSKKLNPAQQKYSAYNRELLAIYEAVKQFRHMLEPMPSNRSGMNAHHGNLIISPL
jgi:cleavage and polyadenylation specificity factor subunit 1